MKVEIINLPKSEVELKFQVPFEEWQVFFEEAARDLSRDLKIDGFRPGSAPLSLIEEKIGLEKILIEAAQRCIEKCYLKTIANNKIEALGQPIVSILKLAKGNPLEFKIRTAKMPKVELPDYRKIALQIKRREILVEDGEIQEALKWIQQSRAKYIQKAGPCQKGDWVEINLSFFTENFSNQNIRDAFILGQGKLIPGLEDEIEGMEVGQEKEFSLVFPNDHYQKELAGKVANFKLKLESLQTIELPEMNDAFAQSLGDFKDLDSLKKSIKEGILLEKEIAESQRIQEEILEEIRKASFIEIPDILLENMKEQMMEELKNNLLKENLSFEDYLKKINKNEKDLIDDLYSLARKRIENSLILKEIFQKENINLSEEEVKERANEILRHFAKPPDIDPKKFMDYTKEILRNEKTLEFLENLSKK